jgi:Zn-dependent protease
LFGFGQASIAEYILRAITFLLAMAVHEFAHAYAAYRMGDTTARDAGRMTLNPFVNINWIGMLMAIVVGFGILGSAPVNEYRMRDRRWGMLIAVLAGPVSNLLLAILCAIPFWFGMQFSFGPGPRAFIPTASDFFGRMVYLNLILFVFNLIPLFPLDGWTILLKLVPPNLSITLARYQRESMYILFALFFLPFLLPQFDILGRILNPPTIELLRLLVPELRAYL